MNASVIQLAPGLYIGPFAPQPGLEVTIQSNSTGATLTTTSGSIFSISGGSIQFANVTFDGSSSSETCLYASSCTLGLTGVSFQGCIASLSGGAVFLSGSNLSANGCTFFNNSAGLHGGALYITAGSSAQTFNCVFSNNSAPSGLGGAIQTDGGSFTDFDSNFTFNSATQGGAIFSSQTAILTGSRFNSNLADSVIATGGAIESSGGSLTTIGCIFTGNSALQLGGAIELIAGALYTDEGSEFSGNIATNRGGAISVDSPGTLNLTGTTFSYNNAGPGIGGAICFYQVTTSSVLTNTTFSSNFVSSADTSKGGAIEYYQSGSGSLTINGGTFFNNSGGQGGAICNDWSNLFVSGTIFEANNASFNGGAIFNDYQAHLTLTGAVFTGNSADLGGAMEVDSACIVTDSGSHFSFNTARMGGALFAEKVSFTLLPPSITLTDSVFSNNQASEFGGGAYFDIGTHTGSFVLFECNTATLGGDQYDINAGKGGAFTCSNCNQTNCSSTTSTSTSTSLTSTATPTSSSFSTSTLSISTIASTATSAATTTTLSPLTATTTPTTSSTTTTPARTTTTTTMNLTGCQNIDTDGDNFIDCVDECPNDPTLHVRSTCGCHPENACNCSQTSCPPVQYHGTSNTSSSSSNVTVTLVPNSTNTQVLLATPHQTLDVTLGWGVISEVTPRGKVIKSVDPISANWTRLITANASGITVEFISTRFVGSMWPDPDLQIVLITQIALDTQQQVQNGTSTSAQKDELIKFSVHITGEWGFTDTANTLHVEFTVNAPVRKRKTCDKQQNWEVASDTSVSETFRVFLANDTATTLTFLKDCMLDDEQQPAHVSDPSFFSDMSGWTVTVVFPSFVDSLYYDPSFALLLGYSNQNCDPLLSWILPASFIAGAGAAILIFVALLYIPATSRLLVGEKTFHIQNVRNDIKRDYKLESQGRSSVVVPRPDDVIQTMADDDFRVVMYDEEMENL